MNERSIRSLANAAMLQAVKDFFTRPKKANVVLKDLRSSWMDMFTDGVSIVIAEKLEKNPEKIKERLFKHKMRRDD